MGNDAVVDNLLQELRRGVIVLAVLGTLNEEQYGYSILKLLSDRGLDVDQGTLYPLLRRLEGQGLLQSNWKLEEARPRRYYQISDEGRRVLPVIKQEWDRMTGTVSALLSEEVQDESH